MSHTLFRKTCGARVQSHFFTTRKFFTGAALLIVACLSSGCPRVLHLNYQPSNSLTGSGTVQVSPFLDASPPTGLIKQNAVEGNPHDVEALYLSQDIGKVFTDAVSKELAFSGYNVQPGEARIVSGTIEQFFLEYVAAAEQRFELLATFTVTRTDKADFTSTCRANLKELKDWMKSGSLIERGMKDCIEQFIKTAQAAGVL